MPIAAHVVDLSNDGLGAIAAVEFELVYGSNVPIAGTNAARVVEPYCTSNLMLRDYFGNQTLNHFRDFSPVLRVQERNFLLTSLSNRLSISGISKYVSWN